MLNAMVQSDLENIDYDATRILNGGFELNARDLYGEFKFALKDGRIFVCKQDLERTYIVNSDKAGTIYCDLWGDMAAEAIIYSGGDIAEFVTMTKTVEKTAQNLADYLSNVTPEEVVKHKMVDIVSAHYPNSGIKGIIIKLVTMGLNNKYGVTVEQVRK